MTTVNVTTTSSTVTVSDDGNTVVVRTGEVISETVNALLARVTALEDVNYLVLEDN